MDIAFKVLMLEDQKTDQELIKRQLKKFNSDCMIVWAKNMAEFREKLTWASPDLILSDYQLPDCNGLEAMLYVKEHHPHIPFVFVTGFLNNEEQVADAVLNGAAGYILKNNLNSIPERLKDIMERHRQNSQRQEINLQLIRECQLLQQKALELYQSDSANDHSNTILEALEKLGEKLDAYIS